MKTAPSIGLCACGDRTMEHSPRPGIGCRRAGCLCLSTPLDVLGASEMGLLDAVQPLHVLSDDDIERIKRDAYDAGRRDERYRWTWGVDRDVR